MNFSNLLVVR